MKKFLCILFLAVLSCSVKAQSSVTEIFWTMGDGDSYAALLVLYQNNSYGVLKVKTYIYPYGQVWVLQDAKLTNTYDTWGNCTSYINCYNVRTYPALPTASYAADNFVIFPNGSMYTQDAFGKWSTLITAYIIPQYNWRAKMIEYGL